MTLSYLTLAIIVILAVGAGWLLRSYLFRTQSEKVAQFDAAAKRVGEQAQSAYDSARTTVGAKVDEIRKPS